MIFASDLDRTLVHPVRLTPADVSDAVTVEIYEGRQITCMSARSLELLDELIERVVFIPTTTRSQTQYERVAPVAARASGYAICANGALVLHDGQPDPEWTQLVRRRQTECATVDQARQLLADRFGEPGKTPWLLRDRDCDGIFLYSIVDLATTPGDVEQDSRDALAGLGWTTYLHGRKLYSLPASLTKAAAGQFVADRLGAPIVAAAGDSEMDRCLIDIAQVGYVPAGSELAHAGQLPAHARVTAAVHVRAAEEILDGVLAQTASAV